MARYYSDNYSFDAPTIHPNELEVDQRETQIDVSQDRNRWIDDRLRPFYMTGTALDVEIPYSGHKIGFDTQPTTWSTGMPRGTVAANVIKFTISGTDLTQDRVKSEIDRRISGLDEHLEWLRNDARGYNAGLEALATQTIERRKEKLLKDTSLVAGLGFKMKQRPGASETYAAPQVRRKIRSATPKPSASRAPYTPEPTLTVEDYEHILTVLENMARVMEQSPSTFREIDEESLRTHFLVQLNGHYFGDATGETFNYEGKQFVPQRIDLL